ncbi:MAG: carboxypeptidase regulatory-like domain-containing protein [Planctomycetota bacterium]|nr:carboxypeptidase regulatory-like domain-containing protein [Planctomycetota bacterium]
MAKTLIRAAIAAALLSGGLIILMVGGFLTPQSEAPSAASGSPSAEKPSEALPDAQTAPGRTADGTSGRAAPQRGRPQAGARASAVASTRPKDGPATDDGGKRPIPPGDSDLVIETVRPSGDAFEDVVVTLRHAFGESQKVTDEEGQALFARIAPGSYQLHLAAPGGAELVSPRPLSVPADEERWVTIRVDDTDDFSLSISGRIFNSGGAVVPGVEVQARRFLFQLDDSVVVPKDESRQRAVSDAEGAYRIERLAEGEYEVKTVPTVLYAPASTIVRAGIESADLRLSGTAAIRLVGGVYTPDGHALAGVMVRAIGQSSPATRSAEDGSYEVDLALDRPERVYSVMFSMPGYRNFRLNITGAEAFAAEGRMEADVELEPIGETAPVGGSLTASDHGEEIPGETVYLHSPSLNARYIAVSGDDGRFFFADVQVADDYRLWIHPRGYFTDHQQFPVKVPEKGLELEIQLDSLDVGRLYGQMVDAEGRPLPEFTLWVRSTRAVGSWVEVTSDEKGRFALEESPAGDLLFDTRSPPRLRAQGVKLAANGEKEVLLTIDWGEHEVAGVVTDKRGEPLPGARVEMHWSQTEKSVVNNSERRTVTDENGRFRFIQLGSGRHQLRAFLPGYEGQQAAHDVGKDPPEVTVQLRPAKS